MTVFNYGNQYKTDDGIVAPFLKWAGGKRWITARFPELFPEKFNRYYEPFLGSGAVFFRLRPEEATLGDKNEDLINMYSCIKDDWEKVSSALNEHHINHSREYYYDVRGRDISEEFERAARFIYLNRTCWNGLYRRSEERRVGK